MILINYFNINEGVIVAIDDNKRMFLQKHIATHPQKSKQRGNLFFYRAVFDRIGRHGIKRKQWPEKK